MSLIALVGENCFRFEINTMVHSVCKVDLNTIIPTAVSTSETVLFFFWGIFFNTLISEIKHANLYTTT